MAHKKKHGPAPVPAGNRSPAGPPGATDKGREDHGGGVSGAPFHDHDPQRRLGDFESTGEHARQQPTRLNDGAQHSK